MPAIDTRLGAIEAILVRMETAAAEQDQQRRADHDSLVSLVVEVKGLRKDVDAIKADRKERNRSEWSRAWQVICLLLAASLGAAANYLLSFLRGEKS